MQAKNSYKSIWKISFPIILSGVAQNIVNVTDTAFLGRLGIIELGAAGNAGIFYYVLMVFGMGFTIGTQIIIGRRNGEGNITAIGGLFNNGLFFLLPLALLLFLFIQTLAPAILAQLTNSTEILSASLEFLKMRSFGIGFAFLNFLFIAFYTGITQTKVLTYSTFIQATVNVIFDYALIFGNFGLPEMGVKGAALASVISELAALIYFFAYSKKRLYFKKYLLFYRLRFEGKKLLKMLKVAFPVMLQNFMALTSWLAFFMIIEQIGEEELAVSHIVRSIYMVLMIPLFGFSSATSTLVSNLIGKGKKEEVLSLVKKVVYLSLACTALFLPLILFFPREVTLIYTDNLNLLDSSKSVLYVVSASMLFFSAAYITFSAVTGTGKTLYSLAIEFVSIFIYLIGAYFIGVYFKQDLWLVWCSEFIYFTVMGSLAVLYLKFGNWRNANI
ncbi:MAG: MATE family efflux transporter [Flavobacteriales bacterium]|nr:MATE family efflux transporter [Flavobacteriales bacterium]|tara:strand:- start:112214 stop:113545 length:1332 start_codon:yes stop_codon:yes gene_type:complete